MGSVEVPALIVSDSSPLNILVRVGREDVLAVLFDGVMVPPAVLAEMGHPSAPPAVRAFAESRPAWLAVRAPKMVLPLAALDLGEREAISLAAELGLPLLIDERLGRREAESRGLSVIGAVGVLERAADAGVIADLAAVHEQIRQTDFRVSDRLLDASLKRHLERKNPP